MAATFFDAGLRFRCTGCGGCCTGEPGYVWVSKAEREAIANHLGLTLHALGRRHARKVGNRYTLKERRNGDCVFFKANRCSVYKVRPVQCRTFPFWLGNLRNERNWRETCVHCPGIGRGRLYSKAEILAKL